MKKNPNPAQRSELRSAPALIRQLTEDGCSRSEAVSILKAKGRLPKTYGRRLSRICQRKLHLTQVATVKAEYRTNRMAFAAPGSFPDSGYYYSQFERRAIVYAEKLKSMIGKKKADRFFTIVEEAANAEYNAYHAPQFTDENGRDWSAYDMDAQFAMM